jgi:hypothetical protein
MNELIMLLILTFFTGVLVGLIGAIRRGGL